MNNTNQISSLINRYISIRKFSLKLCETLKNEDYVIQSMPEVSPTKWHLAHTTWFFETFILNKFKKKYKVFNDLYGYLFNSYYVQVGERWQRTNRGILSRPTVDEIIEYRNYVDSQFTEFLNNIQSNATQKIFTTIEIGLNHEQQHQELLLTDIKHVLFQNPIPTIYSARSIQDEDRIAELNFKEFDAGVYSVGYLGNDFFFDNEKPVHKVYLNKYGIANRLVTNKEYIEFISEGSYSEAGLWLSDGYDEVKMQNWNAPLYWRKINDEWWNFTLSGLRKVNLSEPVCHISFYEAEAFARWAGYRLLTESEWEVASNTLESVGNFVESFNFHPVPAINCIENIAQMFGDTWEWTRSEYSPYPGYKIPNGAIGEYNGKFMSNQMVLRGGSCATSVNHIRNTYRNFFHHSARWQFMGIRLAKDV